MKLEEVIEKLKPDSIISRKEYEVIARQINPKLSDRTIFWQLAKLQDMCVLQKIGQNSFHVINNENIKKEYFYGYSKEMQGLVDRIKEEYPQFSGKSY